MPRYDTDNASSGPPKRRTYWFRSSVDGRQVARDEFESLPTLAQAGLSTRIARYRDGTSRAKDVASMGEGLLEFRYRLQNNHYRVIFMHWGPHLVLLTAFFKNQEQTPKPDLDRARKRAARWRELFGAEPPNG